MRKKIRVALIAILGLQLALIGVAWWVLTQPMVRALPREGVTRAVDPVRLRAHVRALSVTFFPRDYTHPENLDRVAAYARGALETAGGRVTEQEYTVFGKRYRNVIACFGPAGGERIVVGAHYDTAEQFPGADDNASGVAGLIELARLLGETSDLKLRVDLVAYTLEEPPFFRTAAMGSWVHAGSLKREGVGLRAMFSLEMIGYFSDAPKTQTFPHPLLGLFYPTRGNFIAVIGRVDQVKLARRVKSAMKGASDLDVRSMSGPTWIPGIDFSDHLGYWVHGYPALMVTDTSFYRNDRYHTERDTPETLDYARMAKVVQGVYQAVLALSK